MSVDANSVKRLLDSDEPNYGALVRLGPAVLPVLARFIAGANVRLASAAASAAGLIRDPRAADTLAGAARSASPVVRIAAAGAARNLQGPVVSRFLHTLLGDADQGVRKFAIKAAVARPGDSRLLAKVRSIQSADPAPANRTLAARALQFASNRRIG
jgi:HEAT repeat protein